MAAKVKGGDELAPFLIKNVKGLEESADKEEKQAGHGAYGFVFKVNVNDVERIAKKIHSTYVNQVNPEEKQGITSKFRAECIILSKLRHPNIVQFVGVHYGRGGMTDLTLFMECLSSDMGDFLSTRPNLPLSLKLSLLQDVSFGLVYLHEYKPPVVHRDLTARNILISDRCQAKIADLGMAKIVDLQAQLAKSHTTVPGQQYYMPPEALKEKASCTPKLDIFSFGHLALYTVNQELPEVYEITEESLMVKTIKKGTLQKEKRKKSFDAVGEGHCLYPIISDCLFDNPDQRPTTRDLNNRLCFLATCNPEGSCSKSTCKSIAREMEQLRERVLELEAEKLAEAKIKALSDTSELVQVYNSLRTEMARTRKDLSNCEERAEDAEVEKDILQTELAAERDNNQNLKGEVARLTAALHFYETKYPQGDPEGLADGAMKPERIVEQLKTKVTDLQTRITQKEQAVMSLTKSRRIVESRLQRVQEERDRLAEQVVALVAVRDNLKGDMVKVREYASQLQQNVIAKETEAEGWKKEKEAMIKEIRDLQDGLAARRQETEVTDLQTRITQKEEAVMSLTKSRRIVESRLQRVQEERDRLAEQVVALVAVRDNLKGDMVKVREYASQLQQNVIAKETEAEGWKKEKEAMIKEIRDLQDGLAARRQEKLPAADEKAKKWKVQEQKYQEELRNLVHQLKRLTHESEQTELRSTIKIEQKVEELKRVTDNAVERQREFDAICEQLRQEQDGLKMERDRYKDERDTWKEEYSRTLRVYEEKKNQPEAMDAWKVKCSTLEDGMHQMEGEALKKEKDCELAASKSHQQSNQLQEIVHQLKTEKHEKGQLAAKLTALDHQYRLERDTWLTDKSNMDRAISNMTQQVQELQRLQSHTDILRGRVQGERKRVQQLERELQSSQELLQKMEEEHKSEIEYTKAKCDDERLELERKLTPLKHELELLRSQTFIDTKFAETYRRMDVVRKELREEKEELREELQTVTAKYYAMMDDYSF